jgi:hypothetical protein
VWDPRDLQAAAEFAADGPLLPIEFCRVSADGRLTLALDETYGAVCKTYSAPSAIQSLHGAIEDLMLREGTSDASEVGFVELASGKQSDIAMQRHPNAVAAIAAWAASNGYDAAIWTALRATSTSPTRAGSRFPSLRRSGISKRWNHGTPPISPGRWPISGTRRSRSRRRCAMKSTSAGRRDPVHRFCAVATTLSAAHIPLSRAAPFGAPPSSRGTAKRRRGDPESLRPKFHRHRDAHSAVAIQGRRQRLRPELQLALRKLLKSSKRQWGACC